MTPITILVAQTNEDILAELIAEGIKRRSDVDMACERVVLTHELFTMLSERENPPNIVILVGRDKELTEYSNELLASYPFIVVARIVIGSEVVHMDLRQVDLHELILSVCGLFRRHAASSEQRLTEYKVVPNHSAATNGDARLGLVEIKRQHTVLGKAMVWLDALLRLQLERTSGPGNDLPGLSVSRTTIESLLRGDSCETNINLGEEQLTVDSASTELIVAIKEAEPSDDPLAALCKGLEFTSLEIRAFVLCLAPELDSKYERIFGFMHDNLVQRNATLGLIALLLGESLQTRIALANSSLFKRWHLLGTHGDSLPHGDEPLRVDPDLVSWIFGNQAAILHDAQLAGLVLPDPWTGAAWLDDLADVQFASTLNAILSSNHYRPYWVVLEGNDASVWRAFLRIRPANSLLRSCGYH